MIVNGERSKERRETKKVKREAYRARRDRESEEEWQTRLERRRYAAMSTEGSDTYRNLVQDARKSEESQHKSGISAINHYKS